ncbi:MAG: DegT/DnrJ/EryC1/StrS aminotransferase [Candidatus Binatus sp.]|nr:DegT/DnrJ/EryC1/StrS aminotransferase [Candidatus Binatus sp.]
MKVKFVDLAAQNRDINKRITRDLEELHSRTAYIGGHQVESFEREFAEFVGVKRALGVANGTDALRMALMAVGVGEGDDVITVPMTFIATAAAIVQTGARPVFVDVDPETGNMSVRALRKYLEDRKTQTSHNGNHPIKAIVPVHLYGLPAPMAEIKKIADEFNLKIVEDACQAHGARIRTGDGKWAIAGSIGDAGCFSFYPGKNLGAWGDGGAVVTNDEEVAQRVSLLSNHGRLSHYAHEICGFNSRLDGIQAAVLRAKLEKLPEWNQRRRETAVAYRDLLGSVDARPFAEPEGLESVYHLFVIRSPKRDAIRNALIQNEIECGIHYPVPLHLQPALSYLGYRPGDFPVSESLADSALSLPLHPHLTDLETARTAAVVIEALRPSKKEFVSLSRITSAARVSS